MTYCFQFEQLPISIPADLRIVCGIPAAVRYFALFREGSMVWVDAGWLKLECDYQNVFAPLIEHRVTQFHLFEVNAEIGEGSINSHALLIDQQDRVYVGLKPEIKEAVQQLNPVPCDPTAVILEFIKEHCSDIPFRLKVLVHGQESLFTQDNANIKDLISQHLDRQSRSLFSRNISQIDCEMLLEALRTEAKANFVNWSDEQYRFSEVLQGELQNMPDGLPDNLCTWWRAAERDFRTYVCQSLTQRQQTANKAYRLFHKLPFLQKIYLYKQSSGSYKLDFAGMDLRETRLENLSLQEANFSKADLRKSYFRSGLLSDAIFKDANLVQSTFASTNLNRALFQRANLRDAVFDGARLVSADFSGADLTGACFTATNLSQAVFRGANLRDATFDEASVLDADFSNSLGDYEIVESSNSNSLGSYEHPQSYSRGGYYSGYHVRTSDGSRLY